MARRYLHNGDEASTAFHKCHGVPSDQRDGLRYARLHHGKERSREEAVLRRRTRRLSSGNVSQATAYPV